MRPTIRSDEIDCWLLTWLHPLVPGLTMQNEIARENSDDLPKGRLPKGHCGTRISRAPIWFAHDDLIWIKCFEAEFDRDQMFPALERQK
jgi:hypothetical protein